MKKGIEMIRRYRMIEEGDHVIAGVSGGPDSVYLLFLLMQYKKERSVFNQRRSCGTWDTRSGEQRGCTVCTAALQEDGNSIFSV